MLPAEVRLRRREDFTTTIRHGRRATRPTVTLSLLLPSAGQVSREDGRPAGAAPRAPGLVGFTVGRGIGNAVVRNRVARRLRHLMRDRLDRLPVGSRLVVRALPPAVGADYQRLGADLDAGLDRLVRGLR